MRVRFRDDYSDSPLNRIRALSQGFDLMVLGAGPGAMARRDVLGRVTWTLATESHCPVVAVKRRTGGLHFQVQAFFDFFRDEPPELAESEPLPEASGSGGSQAESAEE
jgi:hypothetical protein